MERDVTGLMHKGEPSPDLVAGLSYSIVLNYLNRVVRGRHIGEVIYFQGGTAYNDAVAAAFAQITGKKMTVPPHNGVMGAVGMALIARQWSQATGEKSRFRGYDLSKLEMTDAGFRLPGLHQQLRHQAVHHRRAEELLGRQVLRQVPQGVDDRPEAGDRRPDRLSGSRCIERITGEPLDQTEVTLRRRARSTSASRERCRCSTGIRSGTVTLPRSA